MEAQIVAAARRTIAIEAAAIAALDASINADFIAFTQIIFSSNGRLIVTGIGKSAIVAQKIVATMNSTGTPAIFMHAADAIHGDLGIILPNDTVLCLSKSGDTPEIKVLAPLLKNLGNPMAAMVANPDSYLAKQADFVLLTPIKEEADPNNLAPTASTTAQMALGDALSIALLSLRGFSPADFAKVHPGGALGKQLYLRVSDLVLLHEKPAVAINANLAAIINEITSKRLGATAVLSLEERLVGIITDGDLRRMLQREATVLATLTAENLLHKNPKTILLSALAVDALALMRTNNISQLIVINNENEYAGMIHLHDLVREGLL